VLKRYKIYLDNCCFNRPYDDQSLLSVFLETQAKLALQQLVLNGYLELYWSFILDFENSANPDTIIKEEIFNWRNIATKIIHSNDNIVNNAKEINILGFGKKDSLHLASAIKSNIDFFITVDKGILKKRHLVQNLQIFNPIEVLSIIEETNNAV